MVNKFHPDNKGAGKILLQGLQKRKPEWSHPQDPQTNVDTTHVFKSFKESLRSNSILKDNNSRITILSLALDAFPSLSHADLAKMLEVTETDLRNASL